jgi:hypothetical protein
MRAKARSTRQTVPSQAPAPSEHSDYVWSLEYFEVVHDIRAAKELRKIARVCKTFAHHARFDEDNNIPALALEALRSSPCCCRRIRATMMTEVVDVE